jgi:hypothetical protein
MFNVTRKDMGEFAFFMSQPVAILVEDITHWGWKRLGNPRIQQLGTLVGYLWVFLWFSFSLPYYVRGFRDANIARDAALGSRPYDVGSAIGAKILASWLDT